MRATLTIWGVGSPNVRKLWRLGPGAGLQLRVRGAGVRGAAGESLLASTLEASVLASGSLVLRPLCVTEKMWVVGQIVMN